MTSPSPRPSLDEALLGLTHVIVGAGCLAGGIYLLGARPQLVELGMGVPAIQLWPIFILAGVGLFGPSLYGGVALLRGKPSGRNLLLIASILWLFVIPVGTALALWGARILWWRPRKFRVASMTHGLAAFQARREAYDADPEATCTCRHLAPIELASRRSGLRLTMVGECDAYVRDPVFRPSLERLIKPGSPVRCFEVQAPERSPGDPPRPMLHCTECRSSILFEDAARAP